MTAAAFALIGGAALVMTLMVVLWAVHLALRNAAIVDAGWAAGLPLLAAWYAWQFGGGPRAWILAAMVAVWGVRLAGYLLLTRVIGHPEDGRYVELRRSWRTNVPAKFLLFFEAQALLDLVLAAPFFLVARAGGTPGLLEGIGLALWVVAFTGEATADRQLARFKADSSRRGQVCDIGLWRYSRHPNYFFEWLIWVAYAIYATGVPDGWIGWISPALILYFLLRFTGIPATEAQALRSRGAAYRRYQATTSAFVPWRPREARRP